MKKVDTLIKRGSKSADDLLSESVNTGKESLEAHKASALKVSEALNKGYQSNYDGNVSVNTANSQYNTAVGTINSVKKSANQLNEHANKLAGQNIKNRQIKAKLVNVVRQFALDSKATGVDIVALQDRVKQHVNNNTADILELIQLDRENNFDTLTSVKLRKGITKVSKILKIPINRTTASVSTLLFSLIGYKLGTKL